MLYNVSFITDNCVNFTYICFFLLQNAKFNLKFKTGYIYNHMIFFPQNVLLDSVKVFCTFYEVNYDLAFSIVYLIALYITLIYPSI